MNVAMAVFAEPVNQIYVLTLSIAVREYIE